MTREMFMRTVTIGVDYCFKMLIGGAYIGIDEFISGYTAAWTDMWLECVNPRDWDELREMLHQLSCELQDMALEARFR